MAYPEKNVDIQSRTFDFAVRIAQFCDKMNKVPGVNWVLGKQLLKAGTSVGANVEEAQGAQSKPDFIAKMSISLKEARETNFWLRVIAAAGTFPSEDIPPLITESKELMLIIGAIVKNAR